MAEMERLYKTVHTASEADPAILEAARQELVKLQNGDPENLAIWKEMIALSRAEFDRIYRRLGVMFDHTLGESFYNPQLKTVVRELSERVSLARVKAQFVFSPTARCRPNRTRSSFRRRRMEAESSHHPKARRRCQLHDDGSRNSEVPDRNLASARNRLCDRWPAAAPFSAALRDFPRWHSEAAVKLAHVWFGKILEKIIARSAHARAKR
jgi:arginyl-tRNA synthetase